jgi:PAS domain S-box-containing protein
MRSRIVRRLRRSAAPFALSNLALALIVAIAHRFHLNAAVVVLLCLVVIVLHAVADGFVSSGIVSIIAGASLVYFLVPPIFSFRILDPLEGVVLAVFLIVSNALAWRVSKAYGTLRDDSRRLALAESAAQMAVWDRDLRTNVISFSGEYNKLYGLAAGQRAIAYDEWIKLIYWEDRERMQAHNRDALARTFIWDEEFRIVRPDGSIRWLLGKGTVFKGEIGPVRIVGVSIDITERKRTEAALRESDERQQFAQQVAGIGTFDWNIETGVTTCTAGLEAIYGLPAGGMPRMQSVWEDLVHPDDSALAAQRVKESFDTGTPVEAEWRIILPDGRVRWLFGRWQVFKDAAGKPLRMMGVNMDVTNRKDMEASLRRSEEQFRLAVQATNDAVWDIDLMTGTVSWNETYATLYGRPPETSKSWQWWIDRIHPEDRERTSGGLHSAISGSESTWTCEYRFQRVDGVWADIYDRAYIARDPSGSAWRVIGAMQDLTPRKRAEAELRESEQRLVSIYNTVKDIIFHLTVEPEGQVRFVSVNAAFLRVTGLSPEEVVGKTVSDVIPEPSLTIALGKYRKAVEEKTIVEWEETSDYPAGRLTGEVSIAPVFDNTGTCTHLVGSVHDITEVKRAQGVETQLGLNLAASRDEIRALAASLMRAQEDERRRVSRELHDHICHQLGSLAREISNLATDPLPSRNMRVKLEEIRARVVKTSQETQHIAHQMHTAVLDDLGLVASLKDLCSTFSEQYPDIASDFEESGLPVSIPSEAALCLYRVAQESLQNIAKHSRAKRVWVRLDFRTGAVALTIQDDGAGFDAKAIKGHGGLGLISMEERAHSVKGKLTITSQPGHGTTITLAIPLHGNS